jgi:RNA polymerase sigma-70 factor (ECF subfamily)
VHKKVSVDGLAICERYKICFKKAINSLFILFSLNFECKKRLTICSGVCIVYYIHKHWANKKSFLGADLNGVDDDRNTVFVELMTQHQRKLFSYIYSLVPNITDTDDLLQETNLVLWKKRQEYKLGTNFTAWACRIAFFNVQNFLRVKDRKHVFFSEELLSEISDIMEERNEVHTIYSILMINCLDKLSSASKQLLKLRYDGNHNIQQIAERMGRSVGSIYNSLSQIRRKLWECMQFSLKEERIQ